MKARRALALRLADLLFHRKQGLPLLPVTSLRRVLLVRYDRLGDAVLTTPVLAALKHAAPEVEIDVLASPRNAGLFRSDARVHETILWTRSPFQRLSVIRSLRARGYDAVVQLILNKITLRAIISGIIARNGRTIGHFATGHERLYNHCVNTSVVHHFADKTWAVIRQGFAWPEPVAEQPYSLTISDAARAAAEHAIASCGLTGGEFVALNISAGIPSRQFSIDTNAQIARTLIEQAMPVVIFCAPTDRDAANEISRRSGACAPQFNSLEETMAGYGMARIVVTPDTAIVHIACALGRPVVASYVADGDEAGWHARGVAYRSLVSSSSNVEPIGAAAVVSKTLDLLKEVDRIGIENTQR